jgi:NADPH:quinone reductase-like Zn-dependent oxidoreductase
MSAPEERVNLVAQIDAFGLEHLRIVERALVPLRPHEIRIRVYAASLNNRDLLVAQGQVPRRVSDIRLPLIPLSDCAGEVIEVGHARDRCATDRYRVPMWIYRPSSPL